MFIFRSVVPEEVLPTQICTTTSFSSWRMVSLTLNEHWTADAYCARTIQQQAMNAWIAAIHVWLIFNSTCKKKLSFQMGAAVGWLHPNYFAIWVKIVSKYSPAILRSYCQLRRTTSRAKGKVSSQKHRSIFRNRVSELWAHPCSAGIHKPVPIKKKTRTGERGREWRNHRVIKVGQTH